MMQDASMVHLNQTYIIRICCQVKQHTFKRYGLQYRCNNVIKISNLQSPKFNRGSKVVNEQPKYFITLETKIISDIQMLVVVRPYTKYSC